MSSKKKVIITGCSGRLATQFIAAFSNKYDITGISRKPKNNSLEYNHIQLSLCNYSSVISSDIDCWINNAYFYNMQEPQNYNGKFLEEIYIGLVLPYEISCALYDVWHNSGMDKSILNISSISGINFYSTNQTTYSACKAGLNRMTQDLSKSFLPKVRVNAIAPNSFPYYVSFDTLNHSMIRFIDGNETGQIDILDS